LARIVIIQHEIVPPDPVSYCIKLLARRWEREGHEVLYRAGTSDLPDGDLAIVHVDLSVVPPSYLEAAGRYPRAVNACAQDILKRTVSRNILEPGDDWAGPVIVKSDLNCGGLPEARTATAMIEQGLESEFSKKWNPRYKLFTSIQEVPERVWTNPHSVVERFLPERKDGRFHLRTWIFFGPEEICRRFSGETPILKASGYGAPEIVDVPDFLRAERERLGFDYGKFDFVIHKGEPILLDANKTPGIPPPTKPELRAAYINLSSGLDWFLTKATVAGRAG